MYKRQLSSTCARFAVPRKPLQSWVLTYGATRKMYPGYAIRKRSSSLPEQSKPADDAAVFKLPGFGLPLNSMPEPLNSSRIIERNLKIRQRFISHGFGADGFDDEILLQSITTREIAMLRIMNEFTDRPGWERDMYDESTVREWRTEVLASDFNSIITKTCIDCCIAELKENSAEFEEKKYVKVLNSSGCVVKSDNYITNELQENLKEALLGLENSVRKTNGSIYEGNAFEIIDPSLFPLVYGVTKIRPQEKIKLDDSLSSIAQGTTIQVPPIVEMDPNRMPEKIPHVYESLKRYFSNHFQWLPFDIEFEDNGNARINSYINSVHPLEQRAVYPPIEKMIDASIPFWNEILSSLSEDPTVRIDDSKVDYEKPVKNASGIYEEFEEENRLDRISRNFTYPEPEDYVRRKQSSGDNIQIDLRKAFMKRGIQVIARVTSIELTPENPTYVGESWQIDGSLNENICASSVYYFDCENITDSRLSFRYRDEGVSDAMLTLCDCMLPFRDTYGLLYQAGPKATPIQNLGEVLTRKGRFLAFPNVYEHKQSPFELQDPSKSGHCKVLALLLVNPERRIISTAHVPPQQLEWWAKHAYPYTERLRALPTELYDEVLDYTNGCPYTVSKAKEYRDELLKEKAVSE